MVEKVVIAIVSFILGAVFVRLWDEWTTTRRLKKLLEEITDKGPKISFGTKSGH